MKVRIKFSKEGVMKFIGHLDMVRYFQKAYRRSCIDIAYTQGFSPHQQMSFAAPLGVGLTSTGEYMDIIVNSTQDSRSMIECLNKEMAEGMQILSYRQIEDETKNSNAMSIVAAADYKVSFRKGHMPDMDLKSEMTKFCANSQICVSKKTKKSETVVDIRPMIYDLYVQDNVIYMKLATGSVANLKPEFVMDTFMNAMGKTLGEFDLQVCRLEMYAATEGAFIPLEDLGKDIV